MSQLSPKARALVHSGRGAIRPTDGDRDRIQSALRERLGAAAFLPETASAAPSPAGLPRWALVSTAIVGASLLGGVLLLALRHEPRAGAAPAAAVAQAASAAPVAAPPASDAPAPAETAAAPATVVSSEAPAPSARPAQDRLAQEVALMARATSALHAGRPADALKTLDEYQRQFPNGLLTEERRAARAQALCSLGRKSEAQAELARLAPQSPAAAHARQVCSASLPTGR